jgi:hypothetical protein
VVVLCLTRRARVTCVIACPAMQPRSGSPAATGDCVDKDPHIITTLSRGLAARPTRTGQARCQSERTRNAREHAARLIACGADVPSTDCIQAELHVRPRYGAEDGSARVDLPWARSPFRHSAVPCAPFEAHGSCHFGSPVSGHRLLFVLPFLYVAAYAPSLTRQQAHAAWLCSAIVASMISTSRRVDDEPLVLT